MTIAFVAWEKDHARTRLLGEALGARLHFIWRLGKVRGPRLLLKYLLQSLDTVAVLLRERPEVVIVQTPPVFPAVLAVLYTWVKRSARVVLDAHSGNFFSPKWRWALPLHRWAARRARLTIVHMPSLLPVVQGWGAPALLMGHVFEPNAPAARDGHQWPAGPKIVVPSSFNQDEPLDLLFEAARLVPDVRFYVTGDAGRVPSALRHRRPENVIFTGYLDTPAYHGLLGAAEAVLALTTQDQTFQNAGSEAVWLSRPLIISNWPELRAVFARGTVFVEHTPESVAAGVRAVQANGQRLAQEMSELKAQFDAERQANLRRLRSVMANGSQPHTHLPTAAHENAASDKEHKYESAGSPAHVQRDQ